MEASGGCGEFGVLGKCGDNIAQVLGHAVRIERTENNPNRIIALSDKKDFGCCAVLLDTRKTHVLHLRVFAAHDMLACEA
jgi:hypothetical protein